MIVSRGRIVANEGKGKANDMTLKVFVGLTILRGRQVRTIVATTSQKAAAELVGLSPSYLRAYWSQT